MFYVDARKQLPAVSQPATGQKTVRPSALDCAKLGVYQAENEQAIPFGLQEYLELVDTMGVLCIRPNAVSNAV